MLKIGIYLLAALTSASAMADGEFSAKSVLGQQNIVSTKGFHWITFKCQNDEIDEIETTPGSPPLDVDDPATPGCNKWEVNLTASGDLSRQERIYELPLFDINYGIGDNLQLKYEVPNTLSDTESATVGDSKFGIKYQFYGDDESRLQMAVYPQIQFPNPGRNADAAAPESYGSITTLPFLIAKRIGRTSLGNVMLTGNAGYNLSTRADTANFVSAAVGIGTPLFGKTSILAEIATQQALSKDSDEPRQQLVKSDLALMGPVGKHFVLFGSVGRSLVASDERDHTYFVSGVRFLPGE